MLMSSRNTAHGKLFNGILILIFPIASAAFLYGLSVFAAGIHRQGDTSWRFYAGYLLCLLIFSVFIYHFIRGAAKIPWPFLALGILEIVLFHLPYFWKSISFDLWAAIWGMFPFQYLMFGFLSVLYGILAFMKIRGKDS